MIEKVLQIIEQEILDWRETDISYDGVVGAITALEILEDRIEKEVLNEK